VARMQRLSGDHIIAILGHFGYTIHSQRGSHVKLRRIGPSGNWESLTMLRHLELDAGTLRGILRQAMRP
jgi:predicted RNA binding protein YcfA (HicA-like mRNA interferase family)